MGPRKRGRHNEEGDLLNRRAIHRAIATLPWWGWPAARAQRSGPFRVAWASTERRSNPSGNLAAFRNGLSELGLVEGRDIVIEGWWGEGSADQVQKAVPEIERWQPDVVIAAGGGALGALVRAGVGRPIVFSVSADPVEAKLVQRFARPGGNMTGMSLFTLALMGKRLEVLKEILPRARRVALIANPQHPGERQEFDAAQAAADKVGLGVRHFPVSTDAEAEAALADIARRRDDAVVAFADGFTLGLAGRLAAFSIEHRIPTADGWAAFARAGNLFTYGPVVEDVYRRLAAFVDKLRKGARPGDLPVELPTKVELVVNLKTARALGLTLPPAVLARADVVIE